MHRYIPVHIFSILPAITLAAGLSACTGPVYFIEQLETIPVPGPVMMKSLQDPNCRSQSRLAVAVNEAKSKSKNAGSDFENDNSGNTPPATSLAKRKSSTPASSQLKTMKKERDCYIRAEQVARKRLNEFHALATDTVEALDGVKNRLTVKNYPPL